jgi:arylsulfatase A-like enzyme
MVEMIDFFPTLLELAGVPAMARCSGVDQPPTTACLQGVSYADEFAARGSEGQGSEGEGEGSEGKSEGGAGKQYAFSQWPTGAEQDHGGNATGPLRMGYTVRSAAGFRYTEYVKYDEAAHVGTWGAQSSDPELYDYTADLWETTNRALDPAYAATVVELKAVLRKQYT